MNEMAIVAQRAVASRPRRGRSLAGAVAPLARRMLSAVAHLETVTSGLVLRWLVDGAAHDYEAADPRVRCAWAVAAIGVLHGISERRPVEIPAALEWFGDKRAADALRELSIAAAEQSLTALCEAEDAAELFPYVLDAFGPTSRLDVLRDASRKVDRSARKEAGSFYTPSDVADFMVGSVAGDTPEEAAWLDPACGSGVFLLAVLRRLEQRRLPDTELMHIATTKLWGMDISQLAVDFAAFSITQGLLRRFEYEPVKVWRALRKNLVAINSLRVVARCHAPEGALSITDLFGDVSSSLRIVCNPPYTAAEPSRFAHFWASLEGGSSASALYLPFIEMAWRLDGHDGDQAAVVVPLAFATNRSADHVRCRVALAAGQGEWTMLFFDRQPHALFGEDVKTRNAILLRRQSPDLRLRTSRLLKWTSKQRVSIFSEERAVDLPRCSIRRLVPKLGTEDEAALYTRLTEYRLKSVMRPQIGSIASREVVNTATDCDVFVGGTAYNFLNVFRDYPDEQQAGGRYSDSKVHRLTFATSELAAVGYALLSSRVAFWLWHADCDGFHVPAWFLDELMLFDLPLNHESRIELMELGPAMWKHAKGDLLASVNGGKWTFAFRPTNATAERDRADALILATVGASNRLRRGLLQFEEATVSVDGQKRLSRAGEYEKFIQGMIAR